MKKISQTIKNVWVKNGFIDADEPLVLRHWIALLFAGITWILWKLWKVIEVVLMWCIILVYVLFIVGFVVSVYKSIFG